MNLKTIVICVYLMGLYWISLHIPALKTVFYPTLGAFGYLFVSRHFELKDLSRIAWGATVASLLGSLLNAVYPGVLAFLLNTLLVAWMIRRFHWNAPPILAVSLIPFFVHQTVWWVMPLSVLATLSGLLAVLAMVHYAVAYVWPRLESLLPVRGGRAAGESADL